jgi:hypothetical protein
MRSFLHRQRRESGGDGRRATPAAPAAQRQRARRIACILAVAVIGCEKPVLPGAVASPVAVMLHGRVTTSDISPYQLLACQQWSFTFAASSLREKTRALLERAPVDPAEVARLLAGDWAERTLAVAILLEEEAVVTTRLPD